MCCPREPPGKGSLHRPQGCVLLLLSEAASSQPSLSQEQPLLLEYLSWTQAHVAAPGLKCGHRRQDGLQRLLQGQTQGWKDQCQS